MNLENLSPNKGARKAPKRIGRGHGSGHGKTAGKGHKGQKARSGGGVRPGFEGGQMPLQRRVPKRGFNNIFAKKFAVVNVSALNRFEEGSVIDSNVLIEAGIIKKSYDGVKILANGNVDKKLIVKASAFSESAKQKIESLGGKAEVI